MTLYHGSNTVVKTPKIITVSYPKDFGFGFYTTTNFEQAKKWALRKTENGGPAIVNCYEFSPSDALRELAFDDMTDAWLDFIAARRRKNAEPHEYDIVSGPMADDTIWDYVNDFLSGEISREAFFALCKFKYPTQQTSFHTERALQALRFVQALEVK